MFWTLNPTKIKPYVKADEMKREHERELLNITAFVNGIYVRDALFCTVGNMFSKKKFEYPSEPYDLWNKTKKVEDVELTEEDKIRQTEQLFAMLNVRKDNWDLTHK